MNAQANVPRHDGPGTGEGDSVRKHRAPEGDLAARSSSMLLGGA
jgi:hypothetical protein